MNVNAEVTIVGLKARPELNKKTAVILKVLENGRLLVSLIDDSSIRLSVKEDNLQLNQDLSRTNNERSAKSFITNATTFVQTQLSVWNVNTFFYAMGNTPAKLLTRFLPPNLKQCKILLLGCGDPRNVFFTCWSHIKSRSGFNSMHLDIIMCDIEPTIIARNIVLFKLIMDCVPFERVWSIFYSHMIDGVCMDSLVDSAKSLLAVGSDLETWHRSAFGSTMRFCDNRTYQLARSIWEKYANGALSKMDEKVAINGWEQWLKKFYPKEGFPLDAMAYFWPCGTQALGDFDIHMTIGESFRKCSMTPECIYPKSLKSKAYLNPMILRGTKQRHCLHYALDPTMGFHKSVCYLSTLEGPLHTDRQQASVDETFIYKTCFRQFCEWTAAFRELTKQKCVIIRNQCGDALSFCDVLADAGSKPTSPFIYRGADSLQAVTLEPDVPSKFHLLDTSNLSDSAGLLSMLCVTHRLLEPDYGVLVTGLLSTVSDEKSGLEGYFTQELRVDLQTFSMLTNFQFLDSYNGLTTNYSDFMNPTLLNTMGSKGKTGRTLEWRNATSHSRAAILRMSNEEFIQLFFNIYKTMFKDIFHEGFDFSKAMASMKDKMSKRHGQNKFAHPTIQTFVRFLAWSAQNVTGVDRSTVFTDLLLRLHLQSGLNLQGHVFAESAMLLFRFGLITLEQGKRSANFNHLFDPPSTRKNTIVTDSSPFYHITLLVPKKAISHLSEFGGGAVTLGMSISGSDVYSGFETHFDSFQLTFAKHRALPSDLDWLQQKSKGDIVTNNFALLSGDSDDFEFVVCSFFCPKGLLTIERPADTLVKLKIHCSSETYGPHFIDHFGIRMVIFEANLTENHLVSLENISEAEYCSKHLYPEVKELSSDQEVATTISTSSSITSLASTLMFPADESVVKRTDTPSFSMNDHPLQLEMKIGEHVARQTFPVGSNLASPKAQISRSSSYVKLTVQPTQFRTPKRIFPLFLPSSHGSNQEASHDHKLVLWGIPRVILDSLPVIDTTVPTSKTDWLSTLAGAQLAPHERSDSNITAITSFKSSIHAMLLNLFGHNNRINQETKRGLFFLARPPKNNSIALFVNSARVDLTAGSVVLDVAICFLTVDMLQSGRMLPLLQSNNKSVESVFMTEDEYQLWLEAAPALQERCRDGWEHRSDCEYLGGEDQARIPLPTNYSGGGQPLNSPLCKCGCGKASLADTAFFRKYADRFPEAVAEFTRIAISPLYPLFTAFKSSSPATSTTPTASSTTATDKKSNVSSSSSLKTKAVSGHHVTSQTCDFCGKTAVTLQLCSRCKVAAYCGKDCQRAGWKIHRALCT